MTKLKAIAASYAGVLLFASFVFLGAWKVAYWQGWLYVVLALVGATLSQALLPKGSDLTVERARDAGAGQSWDKRLMGANLLVSLVTFVVAGADSGRFGWSGRVPMWVTLVGVALMLSGQTLFAVAKRQNRFFSSTVRVQTERGHRVCDTGLYRYLRHPGYLGMLLSLLAFPLVMNSYWAFVPTAVCAALLITRTAIEDRVLKNDLAGYAEYASRTRWRLLPGVF
ncbi:MAG: isoprenylcysteine carboxylmethyltransferase family protein [Deltaproteobacteria bacterium]|nr:isoprenylcysteine carboxylmethyltransferase family protein [Deltaproteobacteria bacterium]